MDQAPQGYFGLAQLLPFLATVIPLAIGFYHLAGRMGRSQLGWFVMSLIPVFNFFFFIYGWFSTLLYMLDRLNAISGIKPPLVNHVVGTPLPPSETVSGG